MGISFDINASNAAFSSPDCDGSFPAQFRDYLGAMGQLRPSVVLAFAPKAAGTYLRSAACVATGGSLVRTVHAQGGRDASFYMPTFVMYYAGGFPENTMVTHVHMQALPANRHFINALGLKPVVMIRSIPDMLASYADMLDEDPLSPDNWLNIRLPSNYAALDTKTKNDFLVQMIGPWYASYFATWLEFADAAPGRVCILRYDEFKTDPAESLERLLAHSSVSRTRAECQSALDIVWDARNNFRFNKGVSGRGRDRFNVAQIALLHRQIAFYPNLAAVADELIPAYQAPSLQTSAA
ncbi:MAG TPA: sulfotransferase domain-containing protein [Rhizomicrobium sp.]|nr:sulfotransferase domain-containing protein [Rhizomicrobium sp.]